MSTHTKALQVGVATVNILIFILVFTSLYPFPAGDFNLDLPSPSDVTWEYSSGEVTVTAPFAIDNGGFYDVDDLTLSYEVTNFSGALISEDVIDIGTVKAGAVTSSELTFVMDLQQMYDDGISWMVFNDDLLDFVVDVSCYYTAKLVHFDARYSVSIPWDALVQDVSVDDYLYDIDTGRVLVDYHISTSSILSGSTALDVSMYDDGTLVSQSTETVQLGRVYSGTVALDVPLGSVPDTVTLSVVVAGFPVEESFAIPSGVLP